MASNEDEQSTAQSNASVAAEDGEAALLALATDDPRDVASWSDKEKLILRLYDQIQEQALKQAVLEQGPCSLFFVYSFNMDLGDGSNAQV
jgi:hypothetical protein